ncbi:MAG TPA: CBS domain-containing protein, partial [Deltaproteobacteria bacterium]|nr:CBS domain-containing protein [Deltaproteobacteria bacterium]
AGFFAGAANTPISTLIMVCELSGNYGLLPPLMLVSVCAILFSRGFTIYAKQVPSRTESPAHRGEFLMDVLEGLKVKDAVRIPNPVSIVQEDTPLTEILKLITFSRSSYFPIVNASGALSGIFDIHDVRRILTDEFLPHLVIARDIAVEEVITVKPGDDLKTALMKFTIKNLEELPIVAPDDPKKVIGMITRRHLINAYNQELSAKGTA